MQQIGVLENQFDLTIVIPCLNEEPYIETTLDETIAALRELPYSYEILVVDDGSTDATPRLVEAYIAAHPGLPIRLHRNPVNRGLTRSYVDGSFLAKGKYYKMVCGDNSEPKETLIAILRELGQADMIIPYYTVLHGKPRHRRWISGFYTFLVNRFSGYQFHYYNGLAVHLRYNVMRWGPYSFGFGFQAELITRLLDEGATYRELPVMGNHREKEKKNSALNLRNWLSVGHTLLEIIIRRVRKRTFRK